MVLKTLSHKERVVSLFKEHPEGLTIVEIASAVHLSRNTVPVILAELKAEDVLSSDVSLKYSDAHVPVLMALRKRVREMERRNS